MQIEGTGMKALMGLMPNLGFFSWDVPKNAISADRKYAEIYEIDSKDMIAGVPVELILSRIAPQDRGRLAERIHGVLLGAEPFVSTFDIICPSGTRKSLLSLGSCARDANDVASVYAGAVIVSKNADLAIGEAQLEAHISAALTLSRKEGNEITERYLSSALGSLSSGMR